ncbi:MAG: DnaJ domain-containing protein [Synergistaceae bacterium]|jgi:hypothetical protein|nr:DnaJ domain-containing protein [Synergistaceae bacterium]
MADDKDKNYYQVLGVDSKISQKDLKIHFRKIIKLYHPDLHAGQGFEDLYRVILEAYDVLSNPAKRFDYDHTFDFGAKSPLYGASQSYTDYGMASGGKAGAKPQGAARQTPPSSRSSNMGPEDPYELFRKIRETQKKTVKTNYSLKDYLLREKTLGIIFLSCVLIAGLSALTGVSLFSATRAALGHIAITSGLQVMAAWAVYFLMRALMMESKSRPVKAFFWIYALLCGGAYSYLMRNVCSEEGYGDSTLSFIFSIVIFWVIFSYSTFSLEMDRQSEQRQRKY